MTTNRRIFQTCTYLHVILNTTFSFFADGAFLDNTAILSIWHNDQAMHGLLTYTQQRIDKVTVR